MDVPADGESILYIPNQELERILRKVIVQTQDIMTPRADIQRFSSTDKKGGRSMEYHRVQDSQAGKPFAARGGCTNGPGVGFTVVELDER